MRDVTHLAPHAGAGLALAVLVGGAYLAHLLAALSARLTAFGRLPAAALGRCLIDPLRWAALSLTQRSTETEHPDRLLLTLAPALYAAVAALALSVVPLGAQRAIADVNTGIVVFGAAEALALVAIFLHGFAPNAHLPLIAGFRFLAVGLSYELISMFVLIAAALPAESLQVSAIVRDQAALWNVVRQPLGLPLWWIVTWGVTFTGPLAVVDSSDLAAGTSTDSSGPQRLLWQVARGGMLTVMCAMGAAVWLGGWFGPAPVPGWLWMALKTLCLMALVTHLGQQLGRVACARAVPLLWTVGLPASFVHLLLAGLEALS